MKQTKPQQPKTPFSAQRQPKQCLGDLLSAPRSTKEMLGNRVIVDSDNMGILMNGFKIIFSTWTVTF